MTKQTHTRQERSSAVRTCVCRQELPSTPACPPSQRASSTRPPHPLLYLGRLGVLGCRRYRAGPSRLAIRSGHLLPEARQPSLLRLHGFPPSAAAAPRLSPPGRKAAAVPTGVAVHPPPHAAAASPPADGTRRRDHYLRKCCVGSPRGLVRGKEAVDQALRVPACRDEGCVGRLRGVSFIRLDR